MMALPTISSPHVSLDAREQNILEDLKCVRDELTLLKEDRSTYIKSSDILCLYDRTVEQAELLNDARLKFPNKHNQVDRMLDCCFQLLSLFFMTIGRKNEAPAAYALTSTIKRLLDHSAEADLFSKKDLGHISATLGKLREVVRITHGSYSQKLITLLTSRIDLCQSSLSNLQDRLGQVCEDLHPTYEKLVSILIFISSSNENTNFSIHEIGKLQKQLISIDEQRVQGKFVGNNGEMLRGSDIVEKLLEKCFYWSKMTLEREGGIPEGFKSTYQTLLDIRDNLAKLSFTQAWSLREADLYDYQRELDNINESRMNGNFLDTNGNPAEVYVQKTFLYLIRKGYTFIYYLMVDSKPISEGLLPVYNQLQTLKRCLTEVKKSGGISSSRELYPYKMKLHSIDSMRIDGKFLIEDDIPEGQDNVIKLLEQCYELSYQLRATVEEESINNPPAYPKGGELSQFVLLH